MSTQRVSATEFSELHNKQKITTIDLRTAAECQNECLDGCIALPVQDLNKDSFEQVLAAAEHKDAPVYLLCQSGKRADMAVNKLQGQTDQTLIIIDGGLNAIKATGHNVNKGSSNTISLERQVRIAAGALALTGAVLAATVNPAFIALSGFVGAGLMFAGITDTCAMGLVLARMPWNAAK